MWSCCESKLNNCRNEISSDFAVRFGKRVWKLWCGKTGWLCELTSSFRCIGQNKTNVCKTMCIERSTSFESKATKLEQNANRAQMPERYHIYCVQKKNENHWKVSSLTLLLPADWDWHFASDALQSNSQFGAVQASEHEMQMKAKQNWANTNESKHQTYNFNNVFHKNDVQPHLDRTKTMCCSVQLVAKSMQLPFTKRWNWCQPRGILFIASILSLYK